MNDTKDRMQQVAAHVGKSFYEFTDKFAERIIEEIILTIQNNRGLHSDDEWQHALDDDRLWIEQELREHIDMVVDLTALTIYDTIGYRFERQLRQENE
jgi:hypothetical protein